MKCANLHQKRSFPKALFHDYYDTYNVGVRSLPGIDMPNYSLPFITINPCKSTEQ